MKCYIFDIDGTLADCQHRIHHIEGQPKNWRAFFAECYNDTPIQHIVDLAITLHTYGHQIVYVSGRSDECRADTVSWLVKHGLPVSHLFMRKAGDFRNDDILKGEMLDEILAKGWQPLLAFDDRDRVVAAWRARGIPCAQVAPGDF